MPRAPHRYEIEFHCPHCRRMTPHLVSSGGGSLSRVMCISCGHAVVVDTLQFMEQYVDSVMRRLLAKPFEITTEFRRRPRDFITSLPGRVLTKPARVAAELRATIEIVRPRRRAAPRAVPVPPIVPGVLPRPARHFRLLLSAPLMWAHDPAELLEAARDLGYDGVEMWASHLDDARADAVTLGARARELGLLLTLHAASWDLNLTSRVDAIRLASLEVLHRSAELAVQLQAHVLVVHPGRLTVPYDDPELYWPRLVAGVRQIADGVAAHGVQVGVEHMEPRPGEYVTTPEDANRLVREVNRPNVGTVLDVAHVPWGEDEAAFISQLERIAHVHLSDADAARLHLPLRQGGRDLAGVLRALRGYEGTVALEGFSLEAGWDLARWNKACFEELWQEAACATPAPP